MAVQKLRTKDLCVITLVIVNIFVANVSCEHEQKSQFVTNFMSGMPGQHLLRGSGDNVDELKNIEETINTDNLVTKNVSEIERKADTVPKNETENVKAVSETTTTTTTNNSEVFIEVTVPESFSPMTTESYQATTEMTTETFAPETLSVGQDGEILRTYDQNINDMLDVAMQSIEKVQSDDKVQTIDDVDVARSDDSVIATSTVTNEDSYTMDVYKHKNILSSDRIDHVDNRSNNLQVYITKTTDKIETTTTDTVFKADEKEATFRMSDVFDDFDHVPRNPKSEQGPLHSLDDSRQPLDKRNFEVSKPRPEPKVSRGQTLKTWLEDTWLRSPAAILVPLRPMALTRALAVWNDLVTNEDLNVTDIIIIGYNSNGITWRSRHNLQRNSGGNDAVTEALTKLLMKYQVVQPKDVVSDSTMKALASASKLVPYDSALFLLTDEGPADNHRLPLTLRSLVEKRLKVYTIWTDPRYPSKETTSSSLEDLKKISQHTEGDFLPYSLDVMDMDAVRNIADLLNWQLQLPPRVARLNSDFANKFETLLVRRGGGDAGSHGIPVENGVRSLRVYIEGAVEHAVLYPPNGPQIDLFNESSVLAFSPASRTDSYSPRDVYLAFPDVKRQDVTMLTVIPVTKSKTDEPTAPSVGLWHLSVHCDTCDYRLTVSAQAEIGLEATLSGQGSKKEMLHIRVNGPVGTVRETTIVDEYGKEMAKLPFSHEPATGEDSSAKRVLENEETTLTAVIPLPPVKGNKLFVKVVGRDTQGESFMRLASLLRQQKSEAVRISRSAIISFPDSIDDLEIAEEVNQRQRLPNSGFVPLQYNDTVIVPNDRATSQVTNQRGSLLTAVQIGLSTRLYGAPGENLQLHFEVSNFREQAVSFKFEAVGELRFLRRITPNVQIIPPGQTVNVIVQVGITRTAQPGARDLITFTAYGLEQVSMSVYVYVINPTTPLNDVWSPTMNHNFQGTCLGRTGSDCARHTWSANVIARDSLGGLLRLSSSPVGLMYESNFISGTREEVMATYRSNCCFPRMMLTAIDAYGNTNSYVVDISGYFTEAAIAAVVLGVFMLIALIALVAFIIYWCVRKRKQSRELPTYVTRREIS